MNKKKKWRNTEKKNVFITFIRFYVTLYNQKNNKIYFNYEERTRVKMFSTF